MFAHGLKRLVNTRFLRSVRARPALSAHAGASSSSLYRFLSLMSPHGFIVLAAAACHETGLSIHIVLLFGTCTCTGKSSKSMKTPFPAEAELGACVFIHQGQ